MSLQIEEGKFYRTRDGRKVGPAFPRIEAPYPALEFPWFVGGSAYRSDGRISPAIGWIGMGDIVAEWTDEPAFPDEIASTVESLADEWDAQIDAYGDLRDVLDEAFIQAAEGKGAERHANGRPFRHQPIMEVGRIVGPGFAAGQVMKKTGEAVGMVKRQELGAAERELMGAIVYAAAAILLIREME
jgi:hypothetical protein